MKEISIKEYQSTGYINEFDSVSVVQIQDTPFAGGGFGSIYHCISVNNQNTPIEQVIKIFKNAGQGSIEHSYHTIKKFQTMLNEKINIYKTNGNDFFDEYPAFLGVPQFSFKGNLNGEEVVGYSANNLVSLNFAAFSDIIDNDSLNSEYNSRPLTDLYTIAYHLVRAFSLLKEMKFIHADLKVDNLFISKTDAFCAIIDYDSGSIIENLDDNPYTIGTLQDWLAPEIAQKMGVGISEKSINLYTDLWSVAVAVHYILYLAHPLFYVKEHGTKTLESYVKKYRWPHITPSEPYFSADNQEVYEWYLEDIKNLPETLREYFEISVSDGMLQPHKRITYYQWKITLERSIPKESRKLSISQYIKKSDKSSYSNSRTNSSQSSTYNPTPNRTNTKFIDYINTLVYDILSDGEDITMHKPFIEKKAREAGVNIETLMNEINDFIHLYHECIEDNIITKLERMSLDHQGKLAFIKEETLDKLLKPYKTQ